MNGPNEHETARFADFWHKAALDNFETAKATLRSKRYNFSMFMCHQTVEALLKCAFVKRKKDRPPYIHKLPSLLVSTGVDVPAWIDMIILEVDAHYIKARYFEDRFDHRVYNRKNASKLVKDTEKVLKWFATELGLKK